MSHQMGATFWTLLYHTIEFMAEVKLSIAVQMAKEQAPMFQDWNMLLDIDKITSKQAKKFATGTRGNVGSMISSYQSVVVRPVL